MVVIATGDRPRIAGLRAVTLSGMRDQVSAEQRREILDSLYMAVERHYVAPDTALLIADHLRALDRAGVYDVLDNVHALTVDLTHDLRALNRDLHLSVDWSAPQTAAAESAPEESPGGLPEFLHTEWLSEGIGYLEIESFPDGPGAGDVIVEALRELRNARALIVDLRHHRGGDGTHAELLASHFLPARADLQSVYWRATGATWAVHAPAEVPGPGRLDVPLYILTSGSTGSAGESPAFVLGTMHARATIVGERTAGLGRPVEFFPLPHGFRAGISVGNIFDPATKISLEVTGVSPHVEVPAENALDVALRLIERRCSAPHEPCGGSTGRTH
jgi:retinol-binding protein 3